MPLNAEVSFTWVGHGTWKVRSAKWKEIIIDLWVMNNPVAPENLKKVDKCDPPLVGRPSALQKLMGSGVAVLDIKPGDIV